MLNLRSILCPVDFSQPSERALHYAVALAGQDHALLTILSVNEPLLVEAAAATFDANYLQTETEQELRRLILNVVPEGATWAPVPRLVVKSGEPGSQILAQAEAVSADLIVMGTHGLGGYRKMFFGSTTERVLRRSDVPVLAIPPVGRNNVCLTTARPLIEIGEIIAPLDLGEASLEHARTAAEVARRFDAPLLLLHVLPEVGVRATWFEATRARDRVRAERARQRLWHIAADLRRDVSVRTQVVEGRPADEIAAAAAEREAAFIVMGLRGDNSGPAGRPGSVAYRILCLAPAPVLALPVKRREGHTGDAVDSAEMKEALAS